MVYVNDNTIVLRLTKVEPTDTIVVTNRLTDVSTTLNVTSLNYYTGLNYSEFVYDNNLKSGTYNLIINSKIKDICTV